jgi:hypothetical protein
MGFLSLPCVVLLAGLNLAAQDEDGCIQGRVLDAAGAPVPSVYVAAFGLDDPSNEEGETDGDGYFLLGDFLDAGADYVVAASDNSLLGNGNSSKASLPNAVRTKAGSESQCREITLHHSARARIHLKVTNLVTGEPIESPNLSFRFHGGPLWRSGINKGGQLLLPPSANLEIQVGSVGYENSKILQLSTPPPGKAREFVAELRPLETGCVTGTVVDHHGTPVPQARIQISSDDNRFHRDADKTTDENGRFRADGIQPGRGQIVVYAAGYALSFNPRDGMVTDIDVASGADCAEANIRLGPKAAKLLVDVIDATTQMPIEGAQGWLRADLVDDGGSRMVAIAVPTPVRARTQFSLYVHADGYLQPAPVAVLPMQPGETQEVTVALRPERSQAER